MAWRRLHGVDYGACRDPVATLDQKPGLPLACRRDRACRIERKRVIRRSLPFEPSPEAIDQPVEQRHTGGKHAALHALVMPPAERLRRGLGIA